MSHDFCVDVSHDFCVDVVHPNRDATITVTGKLTAGRPMRMPDMNQPGEPAEPAEIEILSMVVDDGPQPIDDEWSDLTDSIYEDVLMAAEEQIQSEYEANVEAWAEGRREMQREDRGS